MNAQRKRRHRIANIEKCDIDILWNSSNARCHTVVKLLWNTEYLCTKFNSNFRHKSEWNTVWPHNLAHRASSIHFQNVNVRNKFFLPYANDAWNRISRGVLIYFWAESFWCAIAKRMKWKYTLGRERRKKTKSASSLLAGFQSSNSWNVFVKNI